MSVQGHKHTDSVSQNHKAQLANAYNELGKELSSGKIRVVGNYTLGKVIGEGAYGKVRLGTHRLTSTRVAIKQIPKAMSASLTREIHHHRQLHHPHVTQMYEVIATESSIWIVTELCCGGELFDYLAEKGRLGEDETRIIFGQLCLAVAYLHESGIVHRDLKLENVLLDERCRIKLGDFGFTREFEKGAFMDTYCGTTGYAAPEMLQLTKYQGPEVDVWSLGIIFYCLLTGTLPFDDDDEDVMRSKIIRGDFEDPEWLSLEARDLIKNIIQKDPSKRLTIPQILAHSWFTSHKTSHDTDFPITNLTPAFERSRPPSPINTAGRLIQPESLRSSEASTLSVTSDSPFISSSSEYNTSTPTTPDDTSDPFQLSINTGTFKYAPAIHRNPSETTLRKTVPPDIESLYARMTRPVGKRQETVVEEDDGLPRSNSSGSKAPPVHPVRTPARTKRRSVSSTLSDPASPTLDKIQTPLPAPQTQDIDFASLLSTPSPIIFSTALERELLNSLSLLGFDTAQIVHSVLTDACDAAGAVWWMLKKKAEKKLLEDGEQNSTITTSVVDGEPKQVVEKKRSASRHSKREKRKTGVGVQTEYAMPINVTSLAPQLSFVPPTPTFAARPTTPPRPVTPTRSPLLSPSSSTVAENSSSRSHPSTPGGSMKDRDGAKSRKPRSGSVSIMQRATTALEAAGLVKKKSSEVVREDKEREKEKEKSKDAERKLASGEESRSSHGSGSSKLTKSPPLKASKEYLAPTTPPPGERPPQVGSPWILTDVRDSVSHHTLREAAATPTATPGMQPSASAPILSGHPKTPGAGVPHRNRANLLTAFRTWFNEDRKGRRKDNTPAAPGPSSQYTFNRTLSNSGQPFSSGSKRHTRGNSGNSAKYGSRTGASRAQRQSVSSRRSSSVNSRRSSGASAHQMIVLDSSPHLPTRRSLGSHTPNSERDYSSRPSSIRSIPMPRHRKSPSASSAGSTHYRTASPMQKYHKRGGSGSSTRVVRQIQTTPRAMHARSNSAASSVHSPPSSRPTSFYEFSEGEGPRATSPYKSRSRRRDDRAGSSSSSSTTFVAQKRQGPFMSPVNHGYAYASSIGRSSWKKSWGLEPPGWQSRTAHLPVEVLAISPAAEPTSIRDVFSGRHSLSLGDESDWVDEDDDIPAFAGGLGQMGTSASSSSAMTQFGDQVVALSPPPRGHRPSLVTKRSAASRTSSSGSSSSNVSRQKPGHSPVERVSPIPSDSAYETSGRRQLPASRSGPAFRHAIQEEDEGEEE